MKKSIFTLIATLLLGSTYLLGSSLTVEVSNIVSHKGIIYVGLYTSKNKFPELDAPFMKKSVDFKSKKGTVNVVFSNLEKGEYAVALYQDTNGNGMLDTNFIGIPKEPYGFSNNFQPTFSKPDFSDCSFFLGEKEKEIGIELLD